MRRIRDSVVVVTGASSGIGRATAKEFGRRGATVVLAARRPEALREVADVIAAEGGRALAHPVDVRDEAAVDELARVTEASFGRIDTWVNDAAVAAFGVFDRLPPEIFREVVDIDLFGTIHGSRAALRVFREQGHGVLVNVASLVARVPQPFSSPYVISNAGIRALGRALRQELRGQRGIHVSTVLPATVDTPLYERAANYSGLRVRPIPPVYPPERVARTIVRLAVWPRREAYVGTSAWLGALQDSLAPRLSERAAAVYFPWAQFDRARPQAASPGNVLDSAPRRTETSAGWLSPSRRAVSIGGKALAAVALPALTGWYLSTRRTRP